MQQLVLGSLASVSRSKGWLRLRPVHVLVYLGLFLAVELLAEAWLSGSANSSPLRALVNWSILVVAIAPVCGLVAWRASRAEREMAAVAERDQLRRQAQGLAGEADRSRVPGLILRQVREMANARLAFLARPDGDNYRVELLAGEASYRLVGQQLPLNVDSPGIGGEALRTHRVSYLRDTWCEIGLASRRELELSDKIRSAAVIPLVARGEVVAVVVVHAERLDQIDSELATTLELYAEEAAACYENSLLTASVTQLDQAKQLDQLKTEFLSAVAHELRAPLSPMLGWSELLLARPYSPEQARPMLQSIYESAQHLSVLVGDLLDLSRGEAGRLKLDLSDLDLVELIESAVERWRSQASKHQFVLALAGSLPLRGDSHRLRQVLDNMLSNAAKYSNPGSRIFVTSRSEKGGRVVVRISDQGLGLTPDECDRMFTKFFRTDAARGKAKGTGLGLALCKLIVEAHDGEIMVESDGPGCGSAFTFTLPAAGPRTQGNKPLAASFASVQG